MVVVEGRVPGNTVTICIERKRFKSVISENLHVGKKIKDTKAKIGQDQEKTGRTHTTIDTTRSTSS